MSIILRRYLQSNNTVIVCLNFAEGFQTVELGTNQSREVAASPETRSEKYIFQRKHGAWGCLSVITSYKDAKEMIRRGNMGLIFC